MAGEQGARHKIPEQGTMDHRRVTMMINKVKGDHGLKP